LVQLSESQVPGQKSQNIDKNEHFRIPILREANKFYASIHVLTASFSSDSKVKILQ
jgi:hypothetical protein